MTGPIFIRYAISSKAGPLDELVPTSILVRLSFCFLAYLFWGSFSYCSLCVLERKMVDWVVKPAGTTNGKSAR